MKPVHWADQYAEAILNQKGEKDQYVVAAGITPSGTIHIGNFREIITNELISRALQERGKKVRFIYSWDDFDVFRRVPKNMSNQELLKEHLRMPITEVPDTFDCKHASFAEHNEKQLEKYLPKVGVNPEFIHQAEKYKNCDYAQEMDTCLNATEKIKEILNQYRKQPLEDSWLPVAIFCEKCRKDTILVIEYKGDFMVYYECECGHTDSFDMRKKGIIKLKWRIDWPMRWHYEKVDCEPAGKDHFAAGGARQSGVEIQEAVFKTQAPFGFMYEWISLKSGLQFSSSKGDVVTLKEMLEVYEPAIIRYMFAGTRPNTEFKISFDLDVIKVYEDFDKLERIYYNEEEFSKDKLPKQKRIYELSSIKQPTKKMPFQPSFRHLTNILQVYSFDMDKVLAQYELKNESDKERLRLRAERAQNWLEKHAPEEFKFKLNDKVPDMDIPVEMKELLREIAEKLKSDYDEKSLHEMFYESFKAKGIEATDFFETMYKILISKPKGPKLAHFVLTIGKDTVREMLTNKFK